MTSINKMSRAFIIREALDKVFPKKISEIILKYERTIIGLLARRRRGKDTVGDYLGKKYGFVKSAFAEPLKRGLQEMFGFSDEQLYGDLKEVPDPILKVIPRWALQYIGTNVIRDDPKLGLAEEFKGNLWVWRAKCKLDKELKGESVSYPDTRFQNEVDSLEQDRGFTIKIIRPSLEATTDFSSEHISEKGSDTIKNFDYLIVNDGTLEQLYEKIELALKNLPYTRMLYQYVENRDYKSAIELIQPNKIGNIHYEKNNKTLLLLLNEQVEEFITNSKYAVPEDCLELIDRLFKVFDLSMPDLMAKNLKRYAEIDA